MFICQLAFAQFARITHLAIQFDPNVTDAVKKEFMDEVQVMA